MDLFYNIKKEQWQTDCNTSLVFGKSQIPIEYCNDNSSGIAFKVKTSNNKVGPLIAIVTSKEGRSDFYGNRATFKKIQGQLQQSGGISFVMTPEGLDGETINGYLFIDGSWQHARFPLPDIFYNRVASYQAEKKLGKLRKMAFNNAIPFYNPHFFNKWEIYKQLQENMFCKKYLPETTLLNSYQTFKQWLETYDAVIVKPILSNRGNGIFLVKKQGNKFELSSNHTKKEMLTCHETWMELQSKSPNQTTIIQEHILRKQYHSRPYDLRVLVQRVKDHWGVSGFGVRVAGQNAITTHVPQGGFILPFEEVSSEVNTVEIQELAIQVAKQLELAYGYLCEFSMDIGVDTENRLWLFEVNSKPMKFDEPHIQSKGLQTLIQCFYEDAGFHIDP